MTIYAIGDIHGHLDKLKAAHAKVAADRDRNNAQDAELIHVGDLVDRGPDSAGVVDYLMTLVAEDPRVVVLRGNHDQLYIDYLTQDIETLRCSGTVEWTDTRIGGRETLASYGIRKWLKTVAHRAARETIPQAHIDFMQSLPLKHEAGECLFVHAGIRPGIPIAEQSDEDLIWIRNVFLNSWTDHGPLVVHGHTPCDEVEHMGNRLGIDTGAAFGGPLSAVAIEGREAFLLTDDERIKIE